MFMENLENIIANNLTFLRKNAGLTQLEFGEKFNYSDKTVSKWELGTVIPSVEVLKEIADFYGVSLDYLVTEHHSQKDFKSTIKKTINAKEKIILISLAVVVVLFIAAVIFGTGYVKYQTIDPVINQYWKAFLWALPASFIVSAYFTWRYFKGSIWIYIFLSAAVWTLLLAAYLTFLNTGNFWFLFFIGLPVQVGIILLRQLFNSR